MQTRIAFHIKGIVPQLMCNGATANPLHPLAKEMNKYSSKRKKTDEDYAELSRLGFMAALYWSEDTGVYWPGEALDKMMNTSARIVRLGKQIERGARVVENKAPLIYEGPKDRGKLYKYDNHKFVDTRMVTVNQRKVARTRPRFDQWELKFTVSLNPDIIDPQDVIATIERAGEQVGLSDFRPRYGLFTVLEAKILD